MNKILFSIILSITLCSFSQIAAQNADFIEKRAETMTFKMHQEVTLDKNQLQQVKSINQEYLTKFIPLSAQDTPANFKKTEKLRIERRKKLKEILTEEQFKKYFKTEGN